MADLRERTIGLATIRDLVTGDWVRLRPDAAQGGPARLDQSASRQRQKGCPAGSRRTRTFSCG